MPDNTLQINSLKRQVGQLMFRAGTTQIRDAISDFTDVESDFKTFCKPLLGLPVSQLDEKYYFTTPDNWQKIIDTINPILKQFNWTPERFDCDKRSFLVTALVALFFEINTCRPMYCEVYMADTGKYLFDHYANVFTTNDGLAYLWDADSNGIFQKITGNNMIMGPHKYVFKSVR